MSKFDTWLNDASSFLDNLLGIQGAVSLIGDWNWRDAFDDGMSPEDAAHEAFASDDLGALFLDLLDGEAGQTF